MKYLKMLGLAAVAAAALMAIVGAGTASATVFCHSTSTPCTQKWGVGTEPRFTVRGAGIWSTTAGEVVAKCPEGELRGVITNAGSATETLKTSVEASGLTWPSVEACIKTVTVQGGTLEIHAITGSDNGTVTVSGFRITISIAGSSCIYGFGVGEHLGVLTASGSGSAVLDINTVFLKKEGSFLCPTSLTWAEEFQQVQPSGTALYVEPS